MRLRTVFFLLFMCLSTWLTAQSIRPVSNGSAGVRLLTINDLTAEDLLYAKATQKEVLKSFRPIDQKLHKLGYHFPATANVIDEGNLRKFSFTDIITSDDPMEIKSFIEKMKNSFKKDLIDITISVADHQCELVVDQNIDSEVLCQIFSELGFDGYYMYTYNQYIANN